MRCRNRQAGFTLVELMIVMSILATLVAIALPNYKISIQMAKEAVLREDLAVLREMLNRYYADKGNYPESPEKLVEDGYIKQIPVDPMTGQADWEWIYEEVDPDDPSATPGISDVKSKAEGNPLGDDQPYSEL